MKVTIRLPISRPNDPGFYGYRFRVVVIADICPECGGPRGKPKKQAFMEDGVPYSVDCWKNPCGHVDMYQSVDKEAPNA